jgi:hypothetical protein
VSYFVRQCFMQMSYSVVQAAREWFFMQARWASARLAVVCLHGSHITRAAEHHQRPAIAKLRIALS